ncbi:hypothetical protein KTN05_13485 [Paracoccus sp. Z118]|uniref:DUF6473 family protein n=1 Tax=Paracoccus sp. Z118 TaxID=2851017 RepID=UPI001C2C13D2|nr:DUF6473 family protein [Paracoccus sp. Z118]MBV0892854.1 hypothetical protein [Paracoccus sp. Z118]
MPIVHYQERDDVAFDYSPYFFEDFPIAFRGPRIPIHLLERYLVAVGSAATFGRFVYQPYPEQMSLSGAPMLNLGISGARPGFFSRIPRADMIFGKADCVVFEIMSARGYETEFYQPRGAFSNIGDYTDASGEKSPRIFVDRAWRLAFGEYSNRVVEDAITSSIQCYLAEFESLLTLFPRRVILLWFSQRSYSMPLVSGCFDSRTGKFPHFIDGDTVRSMVRLLESRGHDVSLVDITSTNGLPAAILDRKTGAPASVITEPGVPSFNSYYPSQAMHDAVAAELTAVLRTNSST